MIHNDKLKSVTIQRIPVSKDLTRKDWIRDDEVGFKIINNNIGYIYCAKLKEDDLNLLKVLFKGTKGIIIDLRSYPSVFMPYTYGQWLKPVKSAFAQFTRMSLSVPGTIIESGLDYNGASFSDSSQYKGKVVILVNSSSLSQAELTAMALRTAPNAIVVGSQTAGADGDVSEIVLPGGIHTLISGKGVYYPDGKETQRIGIVPDIEVKQTIEGIRIGKDEILERAVAWISDNN